MYEILKNTTDSHPVFTAPFNLFESKMDLSSLIYIFLRMNSVWKSTIFQMIAFETEKNVRG